MIVHRINDVLAARQRSVYWLAKNCNASDTTIYGLCRDAAAGMTTETLDAICEALNCQPGDLLAYKKDEVK